MQNEQPEARVLIEPLTLEEANDFVDLIYADVDSGALSRDEAQELIAREFELYS